jgi:hypothetical protein
MMKNEMVPWARGPFELIKHADGHLKDAGDTDRRIALIGFDNAVEVCIDVYIKLHPRLRGGVELRNEDIERATRNYHTKIEWLDKHVEDRSIEIDFSIEEIVWYHSLRNELYHSGNGMVPELHVLKGARSAALSVFKTLFGTDPAPLLGDELRKVDTRTWRAPLPRQSDDSMELLRVFIEFEGALEAALKTLTSGSVARTRGVRQMWEEYKSLKKTPSEWDAVVQRVVPIRNSIAHGHTEEVKSDDVLEAALQLMEVTDGIRTSLPGLEGRNEKVMPRQSTSSEELK